MTIIDKIKASVEAIDLPFNYASAEGLNIMLDNADFPCALMMLIETGAIEDENGRYHERITFVLSFAELTEFDFDSLENEVIIDRCKQRAFEWLTSLRRNDDFINVVVNSTTRDYLDYDAIITGYGVNITLTEAVGYGVCDFTERK